MAARRARSSNQAERAGSGREWAPSRGDFRLVGGPKISIKMLSFEGLTGAAAPWPERRLWLPVPLIWSSPPPPLSLPPPIRDRPHQSIKPLRFAALGRANFSPAPIDQIKGFCRRRLERAHLIDHSADRLGPTRLAVGLIIGSGGASGGGRAATLGRAGSIRFR